MSEFWWGVVAGFAACMASWGVLILGFMMGVDQQKREKSRGLADDDWQLP